MKEDKKSEHKEELNKQGIQQDPVEGEKVEKKNGKLIEDLKEKVERYDALWDKYLRLYAEFDNTRKRWENQKQELVRFANYSLTKELLVIVDELEHALGVMDKDVGIQEVKKGIKLTYDKLLSILQKEGLKPIEAKDKMFDPHFHEIVGQLEVNEEREHIVLEEVQRGYLFNDKVLRTAKVIIGIKKNKEDTKDLEEEKEKGDNKNNNE